MLLTTNSGAFQNLSSWAPRAMISRDRKATVVLIRIFSYDKLWTIVLGVFLSCVDAQCVVAEISFFLYFVKM